MAEPVRINMAYVHFDDVTECWVFTADDLSNQGQKVQIMLHDVPKLIELLTSKSDG